MLHVLSPKDLIKLVEDSPVLDATFYSLASSEVRSSQSPHQYCPLVQKSEPTSPVPAIVPPLFEDPGLRVVEQLFENHEAIVPVVEALKLAIFVAVELTDKQFIIEITEMILCPLRKSFAFAMEQEA